MKKKSDSQYVQMELPLECTVTSNVFNGGIKKSRKPVGYYTIERIKECANKCKTIKDFREKYPTAYGIACKKELIDGMFKRQQRPNGYWKDKRNCKEAALQCDSITEFEKRFGSAYITSLRNGWIDKWFSRKKKTSSFYTFEVCEQLSRKCKTRTEFQKMYCTAYKKSLKEGWVDRFYWLERPRNVIVDGYYVYVYEFPDKSYYVGLSCQKNGGRDRDHRSGKKKSSVYDYSKRNGLPIPTPKILEEGLSQELGRKMEILYISKYENEGWYKINKVRGGSTGAVGRKYDTKEKIIEVALACKTRAEFQKKFPGAYNAARRYMWEKEIFEQSHFPPSKSKPIEVYVWDAGSGNFIGKYQSMSAAANVLQISVESIRANIKGKNAYAGNFIFTENNVPPKKLVVTKKNVLQFDKNGNFIKIWGNPSEAIKGGCNRNIYQSIKTRGVCGGFLFRYATKEDISILQAHKKPAFH